MKVDLSFQGRLNKAKSLFLFSDPYWRGSDETMRQDHDIKHGICITHYMSTFHRKRKTKSKFRRERFSKWV